MKILTSFLYFIVGAFLLGCTSWTASSSHRDFTGIPAVEIVATVTCSKPDMKFTGSIVSDGHTEQLSGIGSRTFHSTGHQFVCSFKKVSADGEIILNVADGMNAGNSSTGCKFGGVRAEILHAGTVYNQIFTTF